MPQTPQIPLPRRAHMRQPAIAQQRPLSSSSGSSSSSTSTLTSASSANLVKMDRSTTADSRPTQNNQGYFEPSLTPSTSQAAVAAAAAVREATRKRSQTEPGSPTTLGFSYANSPSINTPPIPAANAAAMAVMPKMERNPSANPAEKERKESKMKLFSMTSRIAGSSSASKVPTESSIKQSPAKFTQQLSHMGAPSMHRMPTGGSTTSTDTPRRPSFTQAFSSDTGHSYSSSPPTAHSHVHKHQFLLRRPKDTTLSSASSNSKPVGEGTTMYSFAPSSPSTSAFTNVGGLAGQSQKTLASAYDFKHVVGGSTKDKDQTADQVLEDVWPILKSRVLPLFAGEGLRIPVEDLNKLVVLHIKRQVERSSAVVLIEDTRAILDQGMQSLDNNLIKLTDERLIPRLVEIWGFVFSNVLPYFEAVFLPLQQEFKGVGNVMTAREAREAWGITDQRLDVRRMTLISYRDNVILPLHNRLRMIFSKLQLDFDALPNVTETVGRVLQCVSVLASVLSNDDKQAKMDELAKILKHNWLSRGRTGRNRRGFVGTKTRVNGLGSGPEASTLIPGT